jgi:hypothetical protein
MFLAEPKVDRIDLELLVDDDLFCESAYHGVFSVAEFRFGHINGEIVIMGAPAMPLSIFVRLRSITCMN